MEAFPLKQKKSPAFGGASSYHKICAIYCDENYRLINIRFVLIHWLVLTLQK
jgi:hypothetical protein